MKRKLTNNIILKLLSLVLAIIIWIIIVNIADPVKSRTIPDVPVRVLNENIIKQTGKVYEIVNGKEVDVIVRGKKGIVDSLKASDITVTADIQNLSIVNSIALDVECPRLTAAGGTIELSKVKSMSVVLEDVKSEPKVVKATIVGKVAEGFYTSEEYIQVKPSMIQVTAAESVFDQIATIEVEVDVDKRTDDFYPSLVPKAYDAEGKEIESKNLSFSVDTVSVSVNVLITKTVPVEVNIIGEVASGYFIKEHIYEPKEILVAGPERLLDKFDKLKVDVNVQGMAISGEKEVSIKDYLPNGIVIADSNIKIVNTFVIEEYQEKEIVFTTSDIQVIGKTAAMRVGYTAPSTVYKINVLAAKEELDNITIDNIKPSIDITNLAYGTYELPITFNTTYQCKPTGNEIVSLILSDPNDIASDILSIKTPVDDEE